ncbi:FxLYD domain-containing protein [Chloroflexota bacterium]
MSKKETEAQETMAQETVEPEVKTPEATKENPVIEERTVKEAEEAPKAPEPTAIGDEKIAILKHDIYRKGGGDSTEAISIELAIKNISDTVIGSALFEAELYDIEGNILDEAEQKTIELNPNVSRTIRINYSEPKSDNVKSYCVRVAKIAMTPEPKVTGNEKIQILKHSYDNGDEDLFNEDENPARVDIAMRNVSDTTIATVVFEAIFYDIEGNILDTVKHSIIDLKPNTSRAIRINYKEQKDDRLKSYDIKITRMVTADVEKIQLRRHEIETTDAGEKEVGGIVKNISNFKADAAVVATFLDPKKENIGTRVVILRDIEPNNTKQFHFLFKPIEGDQVMTYTLNIGDIVE